MLKKKAMIVNKLGLHARPSAALVSIASQFESSVFLSKDGNPVNGKSIMGVMTLAAEMGSELSIEVDGSDEEEAMKAILEIITSGFGEMD
ncbi:MAG: HPr family phosphocarrier protein [candidate division Zixibacteria bacterium]|nr:HPr family phosphocarrier protein [candidate division Zixibacteria bacterium]